MTNTEGIRLPFVVDFSIKNIAPPVWHNLGQVPLMSFQNTVSGKTIRFMEPVGSHMLIGFGDWEANTHFVGVSGYRLDTGTAETLLDVPSEALWRLVRFGEHVYLPWTDSSRPDSLSGFTTNRNGYWENVLGIQQSHSFDMQIFPNFTLTSGAHNDYPDIIKEQNGVFTRIFRGTSLPGNHRFISFILRDDKAFSVFSAIDSKGYTSYDGLTWTYDPSLSGIYQEYYDPPVVDDIPSNYLYPSMPFSNPTSVRIHSGYVWASHPTSGEVWRSKIVSD